jgi:hypothetical protein
MHDAKFEEITGSLVRTYGPIQVYRLMEEVGEDYIAETDKHHLIVLADEQDEVKAAIWHYDSRVDLPWITCAINRYLSIRERTIDKQREHLNIMRQPEHMAMSQAHFDKLIAENDWAKKAAHRLTAENTVSHAQYELDMLQADYENFAEALHEVEIMYSEGIQDISDEANAEHEQQMQRIEEGRRKADAWRPYVGKGILEYRTILGQPVLQAGPFHVYQDMGKIERIHLLSGSDFASGFNVPYMILYEDDALGTFDIGETYYRYVPGPPQICRPTRSWFAQLSGSIKAAIKALGEALDPDEAQRVRESLAWQRKIYLTVYDAWAALGCLDASTDNPDPVFDPSTAAVFGADHGDTDESQ